MAFKNKHGVTYLSSYDSSGIVDLVTGVRADADVNAARVRLTALIATRPREEQLNDKDWMLRYAPLRLQGTLDQLAAYEMHAALVGVPPRVVELVTDVRALVAASLDVARRNISAPPRAAANKAPWALAVDAIIAARDARIKAAERRMAAESMDPVRIELADLE